MYSKLKGPFCIQTRAILDYELLLVDDGEFTLVYDGIPYDFKKDDIVLIRPGHSHEFHVKDGAFLSQPHIHFDVCYDKQSERIPISFKDLSQFTEEELGMIRPDFFEECSFRSPKLRVSDCNYFRQMFFDVINTYESQTPLSILECKQKFLKLFIYLIDQNFSAYVQPIAATKRNIDMQLIKDYIQNNASRRLTLSSLASFFHYNECYLDRKYKKLYGISPMQYYGFLRNELAKNRLAQNVSITNVSDSLSFLSIYDFSRFFKRHNGVSPSEYKKMLKAEGNEGSEGNTEKKQ